MRTIPLTKGQVALVDDCDYPRLAQLQWRAKWDRGTRSWRALVATKDSLREMSLVILGHKAGMQIDHRNHDPLDNRRSNLRRCTSAQNACNRRKRRGTKWPIKSVFQNQGGRFTVRLVIGGKRRSIGTFKTLGEAATAYDQAAIQIYGEFAATNQ